jgi:hypothetical protein
MDDKPPNPSSRRNAVKAMTWLAAAAALPAMARRAAAQGKVSKTAVQYQDQPKNDQRCSGCLHFVAPQQCKLVEGSISPNGWCMAYAAKR